MWEARFATSQGAAHQLLCAWGRHIKLRFTTGNLPITASGSADSSGAELTVAAVHQLSTAAINKALMTQAAAVVELSAKMEIVTGRLAQLSRSTAASPLAAASKPTTPQLPPLQQLVMAQLPPSPKPPSSRRRPSPPPPQR